MSSTALEVYMYNMKAMQLRPIVKNCNIQTFSSVACHVFAVLLPLDIY